MISIVLDTNVFVSGIFWSGPLSKILTAWQERSEIINGKRSITADTAIRLGRYFNTLSIFVSLIK